MIMYNFKYSKSKFIHKLGQFEFHFVLTGFEFFKNISEFLIAHFLIANF